MGAPVPRTREDSQSLLSPDGISLPAIRADVRGYGGQTDDKNREETFALSGLRARGKALALLARARLESQLMLIAINCNMQWQYPIVPCSLYCNIYCSSAAI